MKKFAIVLLSSLGLLSVTSGVAFSDATGVRVFKGGSGTKTYGVRVFLPTRNQPPADAEQPQPVKTVTKTIVVPVYYPRYETRAERRKRAIGHRYLGFVKQYRGDKYPF